MRGRIDKSSLTNICTRFLDVSENYLELSMKDLADKLGYKNQSTLTKVRKKTGFIGPDKLKVFGSLTNDKGEHPNIHFIITGVKPIFLPSERRAMKREEVIYLSNRLVDKIGEQKAKELLTLIIS